MMFMNLNAKSSDSPVGSTPSVYTRLIRSDDNNVAKEKASI